MRGGSAFGISVFLITLIGFLMSNATFPQIPWDRLKAGATDPIYTTLESPPSYIWDCIMARMLLDLQQK